MGMEEVILLCVSSLPRFKLIRLSMFLVDHLELTMYYPKKQYYKKVSFSDYSPKTYINPIIAEITAYLTKRNTSGP